MGIVGGGTSGKGCVGVLRVQCGVLVTSHVRPRGTCRCTLGLRMIAGDVLICAGRTSVRGVLVGLDFEIIKLILTKCIPE
jgi:hypothetical protein